MSLNLLSIDKFNEICIGYDNTNVDGLINF
jgi:hypothetical protein